MIAYLVWLTHFNIVLLIGIALTDDKAVLGQAMDWSYQATSHYLANIVQVM